MSTTLKRGPLYVWPQEQGRFDSELPEGGALSATARAGLSQRVRDLRAWVGVWPGFCEGFLWLLPGCFMAPPPLSSSEVLWPLPLPVTEKLAQTHVHVGAPCITWVVSGPALRYSFARRL